ncbi:MULTISPECIES: cupin domain-containing protein [Rhodomicrobium]|uniref:cupin domain-containing protein n=1 Tax=Rhodomicrobium TaxID=1068 RepID=UPI0014830297|nr:MULTISPECIES: cupin domain-containing protein [Rhodomicrobium]
MQSGKITKADVVRFAGLETEIIAGSEDSPVTIMRMTVTPGHGAPLHRSFDGDKVFLISAGALRFSVAGQSFDVKPGERVAVKRGDEHGFANLGQVNAMQDVVCSPARHDQFFRAMADLAVPIDPRDLDRVATQFDQKIVGPLPK